MPAAIIGGVIAGVGSVGAAALGAKAQKKSARTAAAAQERAAAENNRLQREIYDRNTANLSPFMSGGVEADKLYMGALGVGGSEAANAAFDTFRSSTGYNSRLNEGMGALASNYRARGVSQSGAADKALVRFGQDYASNEFGRWHGALGNRSAMGLSAANALAGVGTNFANASNMNTQNAADAQSNAALLRGQANAQLYGTAANALGNIGGMMMSSYRVPRPDIIANNPGLF